MKKEYFCPVCQSCKVYEMLSVEGIYKCTDDDCDENPLYTFDADSDLEKNILPKWNIPEDKAVLFLSEENKKKYKSIFPDRQYIIKDNILFRVFKESGNKREIFSVTEFKNLLIIIPQLHAEDKSCPYHIENINKVCKELKEKFKVERIELFVSHCFEPLYCKSIPCANNEVFYNTLSFSLDFEIIDKITTTNSTGILEVQDGERLKVVDCVEFF